MVLIDRRYDLEISCRYISTNTNFNSAAISSLEQLKEFASKSGFPSHGLIMRNLEGSQTDIVKGIRTWEDLLKHYQEMTEVPKQAHVYLETDMRAMHNPLRMRVIAELTQKLVMKMNSLCPKCDMPGCSVTQLFPGLPCKRCHMPTRQVLATMFLEGSCSEDDKKQSFRFHWKPNSAHDLTP